MFTTRELCVALAAKGFYLAGGKGHFKYILFIDGKSQPIWTVVSRSAYDISPKLQSQIARELRMPGAAYLRRFVECSVSAEDYVEMLQESGAH